MTEMEYHPLANIFPLLEGEAFDALVADIKEHGQREPIWVVDEGAPPTEHKCYGDGDCNLEAGDGVWHCTTCDYNPAPYEKLILDGRNRYRACVALGIEPYIEEYEGDDYAEFVVSLNLHRRHLSESQRAMVAGRLATLERGRPEENAPIGAISQPEAAELLNVSRRGVQRARTVLESGSSDLISAVERGAVSVSAALDIASLPKQEQTEIVARGEREILLAAKQIRAVKSEERRGERMDKIAEISKGNAPLGSAERYPVLYVDPPWRYEYAESESRAIENQYPTMSLDEIKALPIDGIAFEDCVLFMWATSPKLDKAFEVLEAWGFSYRTCAVWDKQKIGMGYYFRQQHELLLVAVRGTPPTPSPADRPSSVFSYLRGAHSAKPHEVYELIEAMYPALPKLEMFSRFQREGWGVWGNQSKAA